VIQILDERNWTLAYDFNGNGQLDTSRDLNGDGCIDPDTEMLPFGQDELVVRYYKLRSVWHDFPRALWRIDLNGYLWVRSGWQRLDYRTDRPESACEMSSDQHVGGGVPPVSWKICKLPFQEMPPPIRFRDCSQSGFMYCAARIIPVTPAGKNL
jgi:hypothetical protein